MSIHLEDSIHTTTAVPTTRQLMDEMTFQQELLELKNRVSEMTDSSRASPSAAQLSGFILANAAHHDQFVAQLRDVKARLDGMQANLPRRWGKVQTASPLEGFLDASNTSQGSSAEDQSLNSMLTTGLNAMNDKIARLEKSVSGLETTLRNSTIFTPDSSVLGSEGCFDDFNYTTSAESRPLDVTDMLHSGTQPELDVLDHLERQSKPDEDLTLGQLMASQYSQDGRRMQAEMQPQMQKPDSPVPLSELLNDPAMNCGPPVDLSNQQHEMHLEAPLAADVMGQPQDDTRSQRSYPADGITFRDNEIARLEEVIRQLEVSHENALAEKTAEVEQAKWDRQENEAGLEYRFGKRVFDLQKDLDHIAYCNLELKEASHAQTQRLKQDLEQCEASRHHFMTKYVDENYRYKWLEQRKLQSEQYLQKKLCQYERALEDSDRRREDEVRRLLKARDDDLDKLQVICDKKSAVIYEQEDIISRGQSLVEERDEDIDRLQVHLNECQRGREYVRDHASWLKSLLKEKDEEIKDLKCDVKDEKERRCRLEELTRKSADRPKTKRKDVRFDEEKLPLEPFAEAARARNGRRGRNGRPSWTPEPIRGNPALPHEEDMRRLWEQGNTAPSRHRSESVSPISRRKGKAGRHESGGSHAHADAGSHGSRRTNGGAASLDFPDVKSSHSPRDDPVARPDVGGHLSQGEWKSMKAQSSANSGSAAENRRHALPLEESRWSSLPAVSAMGRVVSVPDLRAGAQPANGGRGAMSKPASMSNLRPRRESQTYHPPSVETEAESAEEDHGEPSLLLDG